MKASKYNMFKESSNKQGEYIAYNSFTNSLAVMNKEDYEAYKKYVTDNKFDIKKDLLSNLQKGGFVIEDYCNEDDILQYRMQSSRYDDSELALTIAPTLDCNFRCAYC